MPLNLVYWYWLSLLDSVLTGFANLLAMVDIRDVVRPFLHQPVFVEQLAQPVSHTGLVAPVFMAVEARLPMTINKTTTIPQAKK